MNATQDLILSFAGSQFNEVGEKCFKFQVHKKETVAKASFAK